MMAFPNKKPGYLPGFFAFLAFAFFFFGDIIGFGGVFSAARSVPMKRRCASSSLY